MPKAPSTVKEKPRHDPLYDSIRKDTIVKAKVKKPRRHDDDDFEDDQPLTKEFCEKIQKMAHDNEMSDNDFEDDIEQEQDVDEDGYVNVGQDVEDEADGWAPGIKVTKKTKPEVQLGALSPEIVDLYARMGKWMSTYRSGKVLKGLKMIPKLKDWEEAIYHMDPFSWTPASHYEAVKIFVSNLKPVQAQRYLNLVLLPAIREDILDHKKLNFYYYESLKKALYKAPAFFKGIYLPLAQDPNCSMREAVIVGSIVTKMSIPLLHSAAALFMLAKTEPHAWNPSVSVLINHLVGKKYALPIRAVDQLVQYFASFKMYRDDLPVVWHISLLTFVQIYKAELTPEHKQMIGDLLKAKGHKEIQIEIRREMNAEILQAAVPMQF